MKGIIFICGSLEIGKDGIGDYTRRLAGELYRYGYKAGIIALNDRFITEIKVENQFDIDASIPVLRLSASASWSKRIIDSKSFIKKFDPEWLSFQYVPFAFDKKGFPFRIAIRFFDLSNGRKTHIMFHELWCGEKKAAKLTDIVRGLIQKKVILSMIRKNNFMKLHTSVEIYRQILMQYGICCELLPLFSNIPKTKFDSRHFSIPESIVQRRKVLTIGTIFGNIYPADWDMHSLLRGIFNKSDGKKLVIASIGKMTVGKNYWQELPKMYPNIEFLTIGEQTSYFISHWLDKYTDFGIFPSLPELAGKSGTFMAFKEHGVPVFCTSRRIKLRLPVTQVIDSCLIPVAGNGNFCIPDKIECLPTLKATAINFLKILN